MGVECEGQAFAARNIRRAVKTEVAEENVQRAFLIHDPLWPYEGSERIDVTKQPGLDALHEQRLGAVTEIPIEQKITFAMIRRHNHCEHCVDV